MAMTWDWPATAIAAPTPALRLITSPAAVVTWGEQAAHSRIDDNSEQALVEGYIAAATQHLDAKYGILAGTTLGVQTWELYLDAFPCGPIKLPLTPVVDVVSVGYADADGVDQVVDPASYVVDNKSYDAWVVPVSGYAWPASLATINAVTMQFRAGYVGTATVPAPIKLAIMLLAGHWYENREAVTAASLTEMPIAVYQLIAPFRRIVI
jgi:uncharacterized phiE125 gp8 family phage protein